jgi:hypothetical protein
VRVRTEWRIGIVWGFLLAALTALQFVFPPAHEVGWAMLGGAAAGSVVLGLLLYPLRRRGEPGVRGVPDSSWSTVVVALGIATVLVGLAFGPWLYLPGAGILAAGLGGVARELVAERRGAS